MVYNSDDSDRIKNVFRHGGWTFRTERSHILGTDGHYSWKRELNCFQGQSLPDAIFHRNSLEIYHNETGVRIRFCALEALRGWASLDLDPVKAADASSDHWRHRMKITPSVDYDYTYTTLYPGGTDMVLKSDDEEGTLNYLDADSSSFVAKRVINNSPQFGPARLRKPICKCKGDGGRAPFVQRTKVRQSTVQGVSNGAFDSQNHQNSIITPKWKTNTKEGTVDIEGMIRKYPRPICYEIVDLYEDDLHDNGTCFLKAKVYVTEAGWAGLLRFFVRVDGVMARVLDTRFQHYFGDRHVLRERSWREGSWEDFVGGDRNSTADTRPNISLEAANDSMAAKVLKLKRPVTIESLSLEPPQCYSRKYLGAADMKASWHLQSQCLHIKAMSTRITCPVPEVNFGIAILSINDEGKYIEALPPTDDTSVLLTNSLCSLWKKSSNTLNDPEHNTISNFLSLYISPDMNDGGRLVLGDDKGLGHVWRLSNGEPLFDFPVVSKAVRDRYTKSNVVSARLWVEHVVWSRDGELVGAAAGRSAVLVSARNGQILSTLESSEGSITDLAFRNHSLAIASYGIIQFLVGSDKSNVCTAKVFKRGNASVQCLHISPDGNCVAVGFLDKTLRVIQMNGKSNESQAESVISAIDWVGFNAPVKLVRFSNIGTWIAAMGGSSILVVPVDLDPQVEAPILCRTYGETASDGCDGTCQRFTSFMWSSLPEKENILVALDVSSKIHIFDVTKAVQAWPKRAFPLLDT